MKAAAEKSWTEEEHRAHIADVVAILARGEGNSRMMQAAADPASGETKVCVDCGHEKPLEDFAFVSAGISRSTYRKAECRDCSLIRGRKYREKYREKRKERTA